jgi:hypothetical protein
VDEKLRSPAGAAWSAKKQSVEVPQRAWCLHRANPMSVGRLSAAGIFESRKKKISGNAGRRYFSARAIGEMYGNDNPANKFISKL